MTAEAVTRQGRRGWWLWAGSVGAAGMIVAACGSSSNTTAAACDATNVANTTLPSVVTITARNGSAGGTGSGEVIRSDGYILTNNHVISVAAGSGGSVMVLFSNGTSAPATITGRDPKADLAVIKVNESKSLPVIPFASSQNLQVGQPVVALGAPLGLSGTVTAGIVSALDRTVSVPGDNGETALLVSAIQTDAAINPGNSGGALTNCSGDLVGVPSAGATAPSPSGQPSSGGSIGLGFAIPSDLAKSISNEIIATGTVTHSYFGIQVAQISPAAAQRSGTPEGLYVADVVPGGPAANAGIQQGDIITEIDGKPVTGTEELEGLTLTKRPGDTVKVTYSRNGHSTTTTVTLGAQP